MTKQLTKKMTKEELLSYAAGYIDGDGCVSVCEIGGPQGHKLKCIVEISGKFKHSVEYVQGLLGFGNLSRDKDGTFRVRYAYQEAARVTSLVGPYLYLKRRQAELVTYLHSIIKTKRYSRGCGYGLSPELLSHRKKICAQVKHLNHNPYPLEMHRPRGKRRSFAYLAGIIDSDGCIRIERKGNQLSPVIHVRMKDGFVCRWIESQFGGYCLDPSPSNDVYTWGAERQIAATLLRKIKPYLRLKQEQAEIAIRLQRHKDLWERRLRGRLLPENIVQKRLAWKDRIGSLNSQCAGAEAKPTQPKSVSDGPICRDGKPAELPMATLAS